MTTYKEMLEKFEHDISDQSDEDYKCEIKV